jgi:hypothetical protein
VRYRDVNSMRTWGARRSDLGANVDQVFLFTPVRNAMRVRAVASGCSIGGR